MKLLSIKEVSSALSLSRWTVAQMLESGALPGFVLRSGKRKTIWRVSEQALNRWIERKENETRKRIGG